MSDQTKCPRCDCDAGVWQSEGDVGLPPGVGFYLCEQCGSTWEETAELPSCPQEAGHEP